MLLFGLTFLLNPLQNYTDNPLTQVIAREMATFVNNLNLLLIKESAFIKFLASVIARVYSIFALISK
ncbi:MAG: hypothetical protein DRI75_08225 [Bacteroidetes bacterium]|nr:MAG: hypothetical protein DRI75_08225 [Bacteroidota bacterium]